MPIQFERKIFLSGGSLRVNIPVEIAKAIGATEGDTLLVSLNDHQIIMQKKGKG
jgi:antitoxin component of MazEF toxin-antitoxin module